MTPLVFADLDDTLFQTRRKVPENQAAGLVLAATAVDENPAKSSWMTQRQAALVAWLNSSTQMIPVTARSAASFDKLHLRLSDWAVISNGAVIREPTGAVHGPWADRMDRKLAPWRGMLNALLHEGRDIAAAHGLNMRSWLVEDAGLATYVVFKLNDPASDGAPLEALSFEDHDLIGWTRHRNGNNLALIPPDSGKRAAVLYLLDRLNADGRRPVVGLGDSLSDLAFMALADFLMTPRLGQIGRTRLDP